MATLTRTQKSFLTRWKQTSQDPTNRSALIELGKKIGFTHCQLHDGSPQAPVLDGWLHSSTARLFADLYSFPLRMTFIQGAIIPSPLEVITDTHIGTYQTIEGMTDRFTLMGSAYFMAESPSEVSETFTIPDDKSIDDCPFNFRTINCLHNAGITTVGQLRNKSASELLDLYRFGKECLREVIEFFAGKRTPEKILPRRVDDIIHKPRSILNVGIVYMYELCEKTEDELLELGLSTSVVVKIVDFLARCGLRLGMKNVRPQS